MIDQPHFDADNPTLPTTNASPRFTDRSDVDMAGLMEPGSWVPLQYYPWKGEQKIFVRAWMLYEHRKCSEHVLRIMQLIFPNDIFFIAHLSMQEVFGNAETYARLYDLVYNRLYDHVAVLIKHTCDITDEEWPEFERKASLLDLLRIFVRIIEQEFHNDVMQALLGKFHRLIADALPSEKWLPSISELTEAVLKASGDSPSTNSQSLYNMPGTMRPPDSYTPIEQLPPQMKDGMI
jgi:hypothetical protein